MRSPFHSVGGRERSLFGDIAVYRWPKGADYVMPTGAYASAGEVVRAIPRPAPRQRRRASSQTEDVAEAAAGDNIARRRLTGLRRDRGLRQRGRSLLQGLRTMMTARCPKGVRAGAEYAMAAMRRTLLRSYRPNSRSRAYLNSPLATIAIYSAMLPD
jgi:hypothetical protein